MRICANEMHFKTLGELVRDAQDEEIVIIRNNQRYNLKGQKLK